MGKPLSMVSDHRKRSPTAKNSNFLPPLPKKISKKPQTDRHIPSTSPLNDPKKETSAEAKHIQECECRSTPPKIPKMGPTSVPDHEFHQLYPFMEEPVRFNFGNYYGNHLFLQLQKELSFARNNYGRRLFGDAVVETELSSDDDIYTFSSERDMISSFLEENLL